MRVPHHLIAGLLLASTLSSVQASNITLFDDRDTFLVTTSATAASGPLPDLGFIVSHVATVGSITFHALPGHEIFIGALGTNRGDWTQILPGNEVAISGTENLDFAAASPVFAIGFEFVEPSKGGAVTGTCFVPSCTIRHSTSRYD